MRLTDMTLAQQGDVVLAVLDEFGSDLRFKSESVVYEDLGSYDEKSGEYSVGWHGSLATGMLFGAATELIRDAALLAQQQAYGQQGLVVLWRSAVEHLARVHWLLGAPALHPFEGLGGSAERLRRQAGLLRNQVGTWDKDTKDLSNLGASVDPSLAEIAKVAKGLEPAKVPNRTSSVVSLILSATPTTQQEFARATYSAWSGFTHGDFLWLWSTVNATEKTGSYLSDHDQPLLRAMAWVPLSMLVRVWPAMREFAGLFDRPSDVEFVFAENESRA